jgi:VanZ family protein
VSPFPVDTRTRVVDVLLWALSATFVGALVVLSVVRSPPVGGPRPIDLVLHVLAYAGTMSLLLLVAVWRPGRGWGPFPTGAVWIGLGLVAIGVALELVQGLQTVPGREGDFTDAAANAVGVAAGAVLWGGLRKGG